jgi:hypothetical protein
MEAHGALNIDWGPGGSGGMQAGCGHRVAIMSDQTTGFLSNTGLAVVPDSNPATSVGPLVFSGAYCAANPAAPDHYNQFMTGTVWTDINNNNRYDPGEGHANVRIQPDRGRFHAVTGASGGWAIPVTSPNQTYTLALTGGGITSTITRSAAVGTDSVLINGKITPGVLPLTLTITQETNGNLLLSWAGGLPPYQVQSFNSTSGQWQNTGAPTAVRSLSVTPAGPRAFYRVTGSE